jgi:DNA mismatch repair protein MutS
MTHTDRTRPASPAQFESVLFDHSHGGERMENLGEPSSFRDLNLDQVVESLTAGREEYNLKPFLYNPLHSVDAVQYRHEIMRDLEKDAVFASVDAFAQRMRVMREQLAQVDKLHYRLQKQSWFRDAVETYCTAVTVLNEELAAVELDSRGLVALRAYLADHTDSDAFKELTAETRTVKEGLAQVRYSLHIKGLRVTVDRYGGQPDYSAEVQETFAKFKQGAVEDYRVAFHSSADMNHVEAIALDKVATLHPEQFAALARFCARHRDYIDATVGAFDREVQFYVAYLEYINEFKQAGLPFCYPRVSARSKAVRALDAFDLALANKLVPEHTSVVCNDFELSDPERLLVVSGPNQGGKTTFARMFGQLHYLASLGYPVPAREARLFLPDQLFTHFEREEDLSTLRGKLEDELVRIHEILEEATSDSVIVMNESFTSTTLRDAVVLGKAVLSQITERDLLGVCVTFVDELACLGDATVSMVSTVVPDNPAERTYRIVRQPADGLAYAAAIARKYGLTYDALKERLAG